MFGYTDDKQDFIVEHHGIILAMLIPWLMKQDKCLDLIVEICEIIQKDMPSTLVSAFLPIYLHLHLHETEDIRKKAMEFVLQNADSSLFGLLKSDIKVIIKRDYIQIFRSKLIILCRCCCFLFLFFHSSLLP